MQRENERIIYHLMHFDEKDKEWSERPYLLLEDMAIVFDILDLDDRSIQRIDHKKANKEQWTDQFLWESAKKNTKQLLPAKFEPVYKDFRGAEVILKATMVDGVYDSDPKKNPNAKKYDHLTYISRRKFPF